MSFLTGVVASVVQWLLSKLGQWLASVVARIKKDKQIEDSAKQSVEPLKKAQTPEELIKAAEDALRKT